MSYLAELKIIFDKDTELGKEEVKAKYIVSAETREDFLRLLRDLTERLVPEDLK